MGQRKYQPKTTKADKHVLVVSLPIRHVGSSYISTDVLLS